MAKQIINNNDRALVVRQKINENFDELYAGANVKTADFKVTVGSGGDFATLGEALAALSSTYPAYKKGGILIGAEILSGTIITEQILARYIDLSHIVITSVDSFVEVDSTGWTGIVHDSRGDCPFIGGEYGARLPVVGTVFKWKQGLSAVAYWCNRGSTGVVLPNCGFDGFSCNVLAVNNSEIVIREAVCKNATKWGVHARHISRISSRSADLTGCALAAYADRASMLDVREAVMDGSGVAIEALHGSTVTANGSYARNITNADHVILADYASIVNASFMTIDAPAGNIFKSLHGSNISVFSSTLSNIQPGAQYFNVAKSATNTVIYSDLTQPT